MTIPMGSPQQLVVRGEHVAAASHSRGHCVYSLEIVNARKLFFTAQLVLAPHPFVAEALNRLRILSSSKSKKKPSGEATYLRLKRLIYRRILDPQAVNRTWPATSL